MSLPDVKSGSGGSGKFSLSAEPAAEASPKGRHRRDAARSFWLCFAALQLSLCAAMAPACWLVLALTAAVRPGPPPLGAAPAVIVTSVGAGLCLASVGLLCGALCASASATASTAGCLARLLWLRIFTSGAGVCAHLAAAGLLLHAAAQLLAASPDGAACVAALAGLAALDAVQAAAACVHIHNCVAAVQLSWRVAADGDGEGGGGDQVAMVETGGYPDPSSGKGSRQLEESA